MSDAGPSAQGQLHPGLAKLWTKKHKPGQRRNYNFEAPIIHWHAWKKLPRLKAAFVDASAQPGGALSPLDPQQPLPTASQLRDQPETYFTALLTRLASILDPRLVQEASNRGVHGADIFKKGPVWAVQTRMMQHAVLALPCLTIQHKLLVVNKLRKGAGVEQVRKHHHCRYGAVSAAGARGRYVLVKVGSVHSEHAHRLVCALFHGEPPPPELLPEQTCAAKPFEVSHTCHNRLCLRPEHLKWATHQANAQQPLHYGEPFEPLPP